MFRNLKQKVSSDQKVRTPQSARGNEVSNATPSGRSAAGSRLPRPSQSLQQERRAEMKVNDVGNQTGDGNGRISSDLNRKKVSESEAQDSPDIVPHAHAEGSLSPNSKNLIEGKSSDALQSTPVSEKKVPFFKRLEFLTPLKDQVAKGLSESKESISSLVEEVRGNIAGNVNDKSRPDVVAQTSERTRLDSVSDAEESPANQRTIDVSTIPKEQLLSKIMRLEKTLRKYREKYSELSSSLNEAKHERENLQSTMQHTQDKNLRRIQELKEQAALDLKAKMHLEEEFRVSLEEKDQLIQVQQMQIAILKDDTTKQVATTVDAPEKASSDPALRKKVRVLEEQLKFAKDTCEGLRSQGDALQAQLDERLEEIEKINGSNMAEKSKLIKQLREAKNVIEQIEEDKQTAVAEAKRQMHETIEGKDAELISLHNQVKKLESDLDQFKLKKEKRENSLMEELQEAAAASRTSEAERAEANNKISQMERELTERLGQVENSFDAERKGFVSEISHLKAESLQLKETVESLKQKYRSDLEAQEKLKRSALEDQASEFKLKLQEEVNQMQLAIQERELSKMAAVSQQDTEAQNLLTQLDNELEVVRRKVEVLEKSKVQEAKEHQQEIAKIKEVQKEKDEENRLSMQNLEQAHQQHLSSKSQEFLEKFTHQKKKYEEKLQVSESSWTTEIEEVKEAHSQEVQHLKSQMQEQDNKNVLVRQQTDTVMQLEKEVAAINDDRMSLSKKISALESKYQNRNKQYENASKELQELQEEVKAEREEYKTNVEMKDAMIQELGSKMEFLQKDFTLKERDILQKSESSCDEVNILNKNLESLKLEKSDLEKKCYAIEEKLKKREEMMKKHVVEAEDHHKNAISELTSRLNSQKQDFVVRIAGLEKNKSDLQTAKEKADEKFTEAAGKLKALVQKFKAAIADHESAIKEKDAALVVAEEGFKVLEEKSQQLENQLQEKEDEKTEALESAKQDYESKLVAEKDDLESKFSKGKEELEKLHFKAVEQLKVDLKSRFDEEKLLSLQELSDKLKEEKEQILNDTKKQFEIEKKDLEFRLLNQSSDATERERATLQSYEEVRQKLNASEQESAKICSELTEVNRRVVEQENEIKKSVEKLESIMAENETVKRKETQSQNRILELGQELSSKALELDGLKIQLVDIGVGNQELQAEKNTIEEHLSVKNRQIQSLSKSLESKDTELENVQKESRDRLSKFEESSLKIRELEEQIEKFESLLSEESKKLQNESDGHVAAIAKLNKEWGVKYAELKAKAEQKVAQQQAHLKSAKAELTLQCDTIRKLGDEKSAIQDEIQVLKKNLQELGNEKERSAALLLKAQEAEEKLVECDKNEKKLENELAALEKSRIESTEALKNELEDAGKALQLAQDLAKKQEDQLRESENKLKAMNMSSDEKGKILSDVQNECERLKVDLSRAQSSLKSSQNSLKERDAKILETNERVARSDTQIQDLTKDLEVLRREEQEVRSSWQLALSTNDEMVKSIQELKKDASLKEESKKIIQEEATKLVEESEKKVVDLKKKAETRLAQIKKTYSTQLEGKLGVISQLEEEKTALEQALKVSDEEREILHREKDSKLTQIEEEFKKSQIEVEKLQQEKVKLEEHWLEEKDALESKFNEELEQRIQDVTEEERMKYEEGQIQLTEVKDRLEQVLQEAKLKLEENEKKIDDEKDRSDIALQEEKDKRAQSETRLAVAQEGFNEERESMRKKYRELDAKIVALEDALHQKEEDAEKAKSDTAEWTAECNNKLEAALKRSEELEKDREAAKQDLNGLRQEHERQEQALQNELSSAQKQMEVLSKTVAEDTGVELERKLEVLKQDFDRRLKEKEEETALKVKRLVSEYESQIQRSNEDSEKKQGIMRQKNQAFENSLRSDHHKELVSLQREIQAKEKALVETAEKYETEMHGMEQKMSDQVDKAMYRAMTAEKKLQESDYEQKNKALQAQVVKQNQTLAELQQRELQSGNVLQSLEARVAMSTPLADPDKLEYLRRILFEYIMGNERPTMAKVLILLVQFNELESQQILEKHGLDYK